MARALFRGAPELSRLFIESPLQLISEFLSHSQFSVFLSDAMAAVPADAEDQIRTESMAEALKALKSDRINGVMTELDAGALARYVVIWRRWLEAEQEVKRRGHVVKTANDNIIQNPFLAVANKCLAQMAQIESEFGLTPSSRSRIRMAEPAETSDPFEDFLSRGRKA